MNLKGRREQKKGYTTESKPIGKLVTMQIKKAIQKKTAYLKSEVRKSLRFPASREALSDATNSLLTENPKESDYNSDDLDLKLRELESEFEISKQDEPNFFQVEHTMAQGERLFNLLTEDEDRSSKHIIPLLFDDTAVNYDRIYDNEDRLHIWECYYGKEYSEYLTAGIEPRISNQSQRLTTPIKGILVNKIEAMDSDKIDINMLLSTAAKIESDSKDQKSPTCVMGSHIYRGCICKRRMPKMACSAIFKCHPDLGWNIRIMVVDWMKEYAANYKVKRSTYHLAVAILDAYLFASQGIGKDRIQFVAATCLILASKFDDSIMNLSDISFLSTKPSTMPDVKALEIDICKVE
jgi:Cyclin, N-terminal domain